MEKIKCFPEEKEIRKVQLVSGRPVVVSRGAVLRHTRSLLTNEKFCACSGNIKFIAAVHTRRAPPQLVKWGKCDLSGLMKLRRKHGKCQ